MPESAEVKLTTEYLKEVLENKIVTDWVFLSGKYKKKSPIGFNEFEENLPLIIESVECKGKFIYFTLFNENGYFYIFHSLRMTGSWQDYEDKYCRWYIEVDNKTKIWFRNPRSFATIEFTCNNELLQNKLNSLGPDILTPEFSLDVWKKLVENHHNKNITSFLMDQNIISGIGNYIKAEALYYAKISPLRKTGSLTEEESSKLFEGIRIIPRISYNKNEQYYEDLKIYGKGHAKRNKTCDGRITYWDPNVQQ